MMETSQSTRLPLLELPLDPFMEGGSRGATPKGKMQSTLKRARSPAPSSSSVPLPPGPDGWLSPSKRRVLLAEGLLSPNNARTSTPGRRLFSHVDDDHDEEAALHESPVSRALFSARDIEPGVISAFAAAHSHAGSRGFDATSGARSTPSRVLATAAALRASMTTSTTARDDVTVVDNATLSSPATLASPQSAISTPRSASSRSHASRSHLSSSVSLMRALEPSPEIKSLAASTTVSQAAVSTTERNKVTTLAPAHTITKPSKSSPSSSKAVIPSTYSSNPTVPLSAPELHFERPSLQESMTFMAGSRHYPGFVVRTDSPSPPRASSSASNSPPQLNPQESGRSSLHSYDAPSDSEVSAYGEDEDEDKENALALRAIVQRVKRKKIAAATTSSLAGTSLRDFPPPSPLSTEALASTPRQHLDSERVSKRPRTVASPAASSLVPAPSLPPTLAPSSTPKTLRSRVMASSACLTPEAAGREAMTRRAERRRLLEMEVDGH